MVCSRWGSLPMLSAAPKRNCAESAGGCEMPLAQDGRSARDSLELTLSQRRRGNRIVREGSEAAVGVEQDALRAEQGNGALGPDENRVDAFDARMLLVDHAHPDAPIVGQRSQQLHIPC